MCSMFSIYDVSFAGVIMNTLWMHIKCIPHILDVRVCMSKKWIVQFDMTEGLKQVCLPYGWIIWICLYKLLGIQNLELWTELRCHPSKFLANKEGPRDEHGCISWWHLLVPNSLKSSTKHITVAYWIGCGTPSHIQFKMVACRLFLDRDSDVWW